LAGEREDDLVSDTVELLVGKVGRAHGIRGDLTIDVRTDEPERRFAPGTVFETRRGPLTVQSVRWHSSRLLVRFEEVSDRTAAETLRGTELQVEVPADERPDDPEEFYDHQLIGLRVQDETGHDLGEVVEVAHLPSQDLLVVRRNESAGPEVMVPFVTKFVPTVEPAHGFLVVTDTAGLLVEHAPDADSDSTFSGGVSEAPRAAAVSSGEPD
jgi:16S rRNA processing protein RimM